MIYKYTILALIFNISNNLLSWHYNCLGEQANLLYDNISISGQPFLLFSYKDIQVKFMGDEVTDVPIANKNILVTAQCNDKNSTKIWIELPQDDTEDYVDFVGKLFLEDSLGKVRLLTFNCLGQKVIR